MEKPTGWRMIVTGFQYAIGSDSPGWSPSVAGPSADAGHDQRKRHALSGDNEGGRMVTSCGEIGIALPPWLQSDSADAIAHGAVIRVSASLRP